MRYTDPDGQWVKNDTDEYILIKTESTGYVILAPYSYYDGKNVLTIDGTYYDGVIDSGKIDGVIFSNGQIEKVTDKEFFSVKKTFDCDLGFVSFNLEIEVKIPNMFTPNVTIEKDAETNEIIAKQSLPSRIYNKVGDFFKEEKDEKSGKYYIGIGKGAGQWIPNRISQEKLKEMLDGASSRFFYESEFKDALKQ